MVSCYDGGMMEEEGVIAFDEGGVDEKDSEREPLPTKLDNSVVAQWW